MGEMDETERINGKTGCQALHPCHHNISGRRKDRSGRGNIQQGENISYTTRVGSQFSSFQRSFDHSTCRLSCHSDLMLFTC